LCMRLLIIPVKQMHHPTLPHNRKVHVGRINVNIQPLTLIKTHDAA
jgi:hypothetical protein